MSTKMSRSGQVVLPTSGRRTSKRVTSEIYPEIVNGGIERAPSGDFPVEPVEVPPLRELMPGRIKFIFGLANDEIGYLIPKSEWDPSCLISKVPRKNLRRDQLRRPRRRRPDSRGVARPVPAGPALSDDYADNRGAPC